MFDSYVFITKLYCMLLETVISMTHQKINMKSLKVYYYYCSSSVYGLMDVIEKWRVSSINASKLLVEVQQEWGLY